MRLLQLLLKLNGIIIQLFYYNKRQIAVNVQVSQNAQNVYTAT